MACSYDVYINYYNTAGLIMQTPLCLHSTIKPRCHVVGDSAYLWVHICSCNSCVIILLVAEVCMASLTLESRCMHERIIIIVIAIYSWDCMCMYIIFICVCVRACVCVRVCVRVCVHVYVCMQWYNFFA